MNKYVSLDKRSKKAQREYHAKQRRFKIGVLYFQWTKRTGKQKTPEPPSPFSFAKE